MLRVVVLAGAIAALMGCASMVKPVQDEEGRDLVYLQNFDFDQSNPNLMIFVPWFRVPASILPLAVAGAHYGAKAAGALERERPPHITFTYTSYEGEVVPWKGPGKIIDRPVWQDIPELLPRQWYILSKDEHGEILIPCDTPCQPAADR